MNVVLMPVLAFLALFCCILPARAAESPMLEEIVVKGEREPANQESLTMMEVRESPARDIGEALKRVDGIDVVRKGAIANDIVLRGFQKDNINVLMDGAKVYGACPSRMDPPAFHFDFAQVEQIGVIKGPYDVESAGSLGGEVRIVSKKTRKGVGSDLNITYGSYNSVNSSVTGSYGNDKYDGLLGFAYKRSDVPESGNGKLITDIYPATSSNRYRTDAVDSKAYELFTGWAKFGFNPTANSRTEIDFSHQDAEHVLYPYLKMDADYDRTSIVKWNYKVEKVSPLIKEVRLEAYWDKVSHLMDDRLRVSSTSSARVTRDYSMQTDARTQGIGTKGIVSLAIGPGALKGGVDYTNRNWNSLNQRAMYTMVQAYTTINMIPDVFVDNFGMFSEYEIPFAKKFVFKTGIRGDLTWVNADSGNNAVSAGNGTDFGGVSANIQLIYKPVKELELFAGLARGYRTPDPEELYIDVPGVGTNATWRGNPDLKATVNHEADLGIKFATDRLYVSTSLFYSDLIDYVNFYQASTSLKSYQNIDASIWGAELGSQISLPFDIYLKGSLSYSEGRNKDGNRPLPEIPPLRGSVAVRYDNGAFFAEIAENMAREQDRVDTGLNEEPTAGWMTTDLKAGYNYKALSVYVGIYNLLDKQYYSYLSYLRDPFAGGVGVKVPENGRNFYVTVACRF